MSLLMLGLQTNRRGQHYSEQSRDPPNSSLSLKQKSDHSSTAPVVLNRTLLYLCIAWSEQSTLTHINTSTYTCRLVSGEFLSALASSLISSFFPQYFFLYFLWTFSFITHLNRCQVHKLYFRTETINN